MGISIKIVVMAFIRKVKTSSGAIAVQIAHKSSGRVIRIEHLGSAHNESDLQALLELAKSRLVGNQLQLFPEVKSTLKVNLKQSASTLLWNILKEQSDQLGFSELADEVFTALCLARIVEPTSKLDSLRVMADLGVSQLDKNQLYRCLLKVVTQNYRKTISDKCYAYAASCGISLVLYDVTTLYFEIQKEDEYRKPGLSKERRLEPQIVIGLLVDAKGFPLGLHSFEGNKAETTTIIPVVNEFKEQHNITSPITIVADAGMLSTKNLEELTQSGYHYIVGSRMNKIPYDITTYQQTKQSLIDGQIITTNHDYYRVIYQYKDKRAKLDLHNIEKQIKKATAIVEGKTTAKKTKFLNFKSKKATLNQALIDKARTLAGIKGYVTNLSNESDLRVINYYHQLFQVEASFRMAKSDLKARPIFHHKRDSIEAHLTIVLAALAIGKKIEHQTGMSIKHFIKTLLPIRSGIVTIGNQQYVAEAEIPNYVDNLLKKLHSGH